VKPRRPVRVLTGVLTNITKHGALRHLPSVGCAAFALAMVAGTVAIAAGGAAYFNAEEYAPFVIEKLPLADEEFYQRALQVHVVSASFALPACVALLSAWLLRKAPRLHRYLGRVTGLVVLAALAPSGFYLSHLAKGGPAGVAGFVLSGVIVVAAMVWGVVTARRRQFVAHRRAMWHVTAQLSVAVTSRAMLFVLDAANVEATFAYLLSLWLPVVGSAVAVELLTVCRSSPVLVPLSVSRQPLATASLVPVMERA